VIDSIFHHPAAFAAAAVGLLIGFLLGWIVSKPWHRMRWNRRRSGGRMVLPDELRCHVWPLFVLFAAAPAPVLPVKRAAWEMGIDPDAMGGMGAALVIGLVAGLGVWGGSWLLMRLGAMLAHAVWLAWRWISPRCEELSRDYEWPAAETVVLGSPAEVKQWAEERIRPSGEAPAGTREGACAPRTQGACAPRFEDLAHDVEGTDPFAVAGLYRAVHLATAPRLEAADWRHFLDGLKRQIGRAAGAVNRAQHHLSVEDYGDALGGAETDLLQALLTIDGLLRRLELQTLPAVHNANASANPEPGRRVA
jgi:hypothetical protein